MQLTIVDSVFLLYVVSVAISKAMDGAIVHHCLPIRKIKGFLKRLILLIRLKIIFKADKENKTRNLLKFF